MLKNKLRRLAVDQNVAINTNMVMTPKVISDLDGFEAFRSQLKTVGLPFEDLDKDKHLLVGYYNDNVLIGTGAMEVYGDYGLLRSVSIVEANQGKKSGSKIIFHLLDKAKQSNLKGLYLLTETAKDFFFKIGFEVIERDGAVDEVKQSSEFTHVCPTSAVCMFLKLESAC